MIRAVPMAIALAILIAAAIPAHAGDTYYLGEREGILLLTNVPSAPGLRPLHRKEDRFVAEERSLPFRGLIRAAAVEAGLREELLDAVIAVESGYRPQAVSPKGAMGLMQLMPDTAAALGVDRPFDPRQNVFAGARHLRRLLDRFDGDLELALAAYNAGENRVRESGAIPAILETRRYVDRILDRLGRPERTVPAVRPAASRDPEPTPALFYHVDENGLTIFTDVPGAGVRPARR